MTLGALSERWEQEAGTLARRGDERGASMLRSLAAELRTELWEHGQEPLTLEQAADLGGYSVDYLRHLVADGTLANCGRKGSPRIARRDVPRKPGAVA